MVKKSNRARGFARNDREACKNLIIFWVAPFVPQTTSCLQRSIEFNMSILCLIGARLTIAVSLQLLAKRRILVRYRSRQLEFLSVLSKFVF